MTFDSHVLSLVSVAARLVNELTTGERGGQSYLAPHGQALGDAAAEALGGEGRSTPAVSPHEAVALSNAASQMRQVFESAEAADLPTATRVLNELMMTTGARPQLDPLSEGGWHVHFHGANDTLATGWAAGCATGLALAIGSNLAGRLGVCDAQACDRVYVDISRNSSKRFCSLACQNRTKAAAHRTRQ